MPEPPEIALLIALHDEESVQAAMEALVPDHAGIRWSPRRVSLPDDLLAIDSGSAARITLVDARDIPADESSSSVFPLPFVAVGAGQSPEVKARAFSIGAADYLDGIPTPIEFQARLRRHAAAYASELDQRRHSRDADLASRALRSSNSELQDLNDMFRQSIDALRDKVATQDVRLESIGTVGIELNEIRDLDILMQHILTRARLLVRAESGSILTREHQALVVRFMQNDHHLESGRSIADLAGGLRVPIDLESIPGRVSTTGEPINVEDVYRTSSGPGCRFIHAQDQRLGYRTRSVLAYPLKSPSGDPLGVLQLANPTTAEGVPKGRFDSEDLGLIRNLASIASVALERARITRSLIERMIAMAEIHDPRETGAHVRRVAGYSRVLFEGWARRRGMDRVTMEHHRDRLSIAAMLHDVGKIGIPDTLLKKPGRLDDAEYARMQMHTLIGARLFEHTHADFDELARVVALHHHERWDGTGYPGTLDPDRALSSPPVEPIRHGLAGEEIPIEARIVGLADVYDALSSVRSYKDAWPEERVNDEIRNLSGTHFDPELVAIFEEELDRIRAVRDTHSPGDH